MSRLKRKTQQCRARGVCPYRHEFLGHWDVFVGSEWPFGPRDLKLTHRQAVNFAYQIAVSKKQRITVEVLP